MKNFKIGDTFYLIDQEKYEGDYKGPIVVTDIFDEGVYGKHPNHEINGLYYLYEITKINPCGDKKATYAVFVHHPSCSGFESFEAACEEAKKASDKFGEAYVCKLEKKYTTTAELVRKTKTEETNY